LACDQITAYVVFIDGLVDAMEIQASYENVKKSLDNELVSHYKALLRCN
jgi:hypothetical protein